MSAVQSSAASSWASDTCRAGPGRSSGAYSRAACGTGIGTPGSPCGREGAQRERDHRPAASHPAATHHARTADPHRGLLVRGRDGEDPGPAVQRRTWAAVTAAFGRAQDNDAPVPGRPARRAPRTAAGGRPVSPGRGRCRARRPGPPGRWCAARRPHSGRPPRAPRPPGRPRRGPAPRPRATAGRPCRRRRRRPRVARRPGCGAARARSVTVFDVSAVSGPARTSSCTAGGAKASSTCPTPVACSGIRPPTRLNTRTASGWARRST